MAVSQSDPPDTIFSVKARIGAWVRAFFRKPILGVAICTFLLLITYDATLHLVTPNPLLVGPQDGAGPFTVSIDEHRNFIKGDRILDAAQGSLVGWIGDIRLEPTYAEDALIEFSCAGETYETRHMHFSPGVRPIGTRFGHMAVPLDVPDESDCDIARTIGVTPWYGITWHMKLNSVHLHVIKRVMP